ncbi:UDP-glucose 4-epimerase family protein [Cylindrospermopsis raciborskii]|uniref:UDP-glucose 4-epimerase family protein n=1 Tax=Cylindrospermopsis raciborskii TaxID=77022 RepID=UPI0011445E56|nr:SDR family oxidoreductase [Cylindrospermopsis raciborskii]TPX27628.1 SDR family oxidoreductase [Cylindrospermopsis raciborskii GIHE 2018]
MNILITGANGFVGKALCHELSGRSTHNLVFAATRSTHSQITLPLNVQQVIVPSLQDLVQRRDIISQVDCIIHLAARVHQMKDNAANPLSAFRLINTEATYQLARAVAEQGVKRFIYLSSIKVNGEETTEYHPFTAEDIPAPRDPYGISKAEAEIQLKNISSETGLEVVIIRPPLVYGSGVKGNFLSMMQWLDKGFPLPLGAIYNRRSLVSLPNLVSLITTCIHHPAAANQTFLVSDNADISTTDLIRQMAHSLGKKPLLIPVPTYCLKFMASLLGKQSLALRLCSSLQVDIQKTQALLHWNPPVSLKEGINLTANAFIASKH